MASVGGRQGSCGVTSRGREEGQFPKEECCADKAGVSIPLSLSEGGGRAVGRGPGACGLLENRRVVQGEHMENPVATEAGQ